ncbi:MULTISPECIES: transcription termination factor NusA [Bacillota]|uniref:Transcription termination/antitermination protein NusA n=2 Tax=Amedibacillus TaxID=2749846 RepID=A0A7G9GM40_9FIRM|nr:MULTISPECIES: transcription termination factor NusA [Bacillota]QNM11872.1 transcription termination/antitermination protein NusA [[Eubacterium] hominis]MCH4287205.1 transcription termination factor NusA [Amedibacillus hominis]RGB50620.1 transcription termination/antitermination protein NusA [Absiella sp. AM22-9]RGB62897.1 transcription termination/antitermination protein NusA [Absiella sp. AM10-20]RGB64822.1 transcription termination/antitermination protein NusA [Absiella sp. AM09-45]
MKLKDFMAAMQAIESDRKLSKEIVIEALQEALSKAYRKHIEIPDALVRVDVNEKSGDIKVYQQRAVVETVEDDELEISLEDAKKVNQAFELGDLVETEVSIANLGRAAVILAKNVMKQKIREAEKLVVYEEYCDKVDEMVFGTIESVEEKFCVVNIGKTLALMPKNQQIPNERYKEGQMIRVVIIEVNKETKGAQVLVSRADATLVKRLFEKEVPEIYQGIIEIKAIAREAGERTKMAVYSHNENIDPIGACIGPRGQRVQVIIDELHGEKIDIFEWSEDVSELIKNALSPAEVLAVIPSEEKKGGLLVVVPDNQLSLAIGKRGKNARLAVKLTGSKIDIKAQSDVDAMGIDWKNIAIKQREEFLARQAEEKAAAQQEMFEESKEQDAVDIDEAGVQFDVAADEIEEEIDDTVEATVEPEKADIVMDEDTAEIMDEYVEPEEEKEETELEKAARIAKEKQRLEGLNVKEKQEYKSKFEELADAKTKQEPAVAAKPKYKKYEEKEEPRRKATFDLNKKDYGMKPIYSEEELAEIEREQMEEEENDWIHDDIDFDEYDEYYDK